MMKMADGFNQVIIKGPAIEILSWKLSHVVFRNVIQRQNTTGLSFQRNIRLETKSCRISYHKSMVKYDRT